ncbi:MAG: hypothetical protein ACRDS0_38670 [Pseudonocardiaceae bacterium]
MTSAEKWYPRSYKDGDTHLGRPTGPGTVTARCGLVFTPLHALFDDGPVFGGAPAGCQACPRCRAAQRAPQSDPDPDGAAVLDLIETLHSLRKKGDTHG